MWISVTESDLATALTGPELSAAKTAALKAAQADPVPEDIAQVTREVRGRVAACRSNQLGAAGTIPDECKAAAIDMVVYRLCKRVPGKALLTAERADAYDKAIAFMRDVANCNVAIEQPGTASEEVTSGAVAPKICRPCRQFTRGKQDGI
jgi:hypothetical protein